MQLREFSDLTEVNKALNEKILDLTNKVTSLQSQLDKVKTVEQERDTLKTDNEKLKAFVQRKL